MHSFIRLNASAYNCHISLANYIIDFAKIHTFFYLQGILGALSVQGIDAGFNAY